MFQRLDALEAEEEGRTAAGEYDEPESDSEERKQLHRTAVRFVNIAETLLHVFMQVLYEWVL